MVTNDAPSAIDVLVAEHDVCRRHLEATASALAGGASGSVQATRTAFGHLWSLLQFLEDELETHIAKEEELLFPRLRAAMPADDRLIDDMVAEHDLVRIKRSDVRAVLVDMLDSQDGVRLDRALLLATLANIIPPVESLTHMRHVVDIVATKLRVHFENEEELVFPLAPQLLSKEDLDQVAAEMAAIDDAAAAV